MALELDSLLRLLWQGLGSLGSIVTLSMPGHHVERERTSRIR
jgi:hypothetical protein